MDRVLLAVALVALVSVVAVVASRRRPDPPTQNRWQVPTQLDRSELDAVDSPWLVVVFTSATCGTCAEVVEKAGHLASDTVAVQEVESNAQRDLHERYGIEAVPTLVVADAEGVVRATHIGPVAAAELWATVADLREPGEI